MKVLWVKANRLLPPQSGGDIRSYNVARCLGTRHELTFLSYYDGDLDRKYERALQEEFLGCVCLCTGKSDRTPNRWLDYILSLPGGVPHAVGRFASVAVQEKIAHWYCRMSFDVVICDFLDAAINFPRKLEIPSVLFQHNVESEIWRRYAEAETNRWKRMVYEVESRKMLRYEESVVRHFHHVIAVSEHDRRLMSRWTNPERITVVPTGVDLKTFRPATQTPGKPLVMFVGAMDWEPNVDAVEYFCGQVWPTIRRDMPSARFRIVGRNPGRRVQMLASDSIEVTGSVPFVQNHLREAAVVVVPLRIGGGTRLKIYEAMAMGKAVVSTSVGAEGLDVHNGRDIMLADQPAAFSEAVKVLLQDSELRGRYERAGIAIAQLYDWPEIGKKFTAVLEEIAGSKEKVVGISGARMLEGVPLSDRCGERGC